MQQFPKRLGWLGVLLAGIALTVVGMAVAAEEPDRQAASVGAGLFRAYCASCHGTSATGDGEIAQYLKVKPADLVGIAENNGGEFPFETVRKVIDGRVAVKGHGHGEMPVWGDALKVAGGGANEEQIQGKVKALTHFLWTIQR